MAEFAQLRKEKWTEPLISLTDLKLLSAEELQSIVEKIDHFEYKIQSQHRTLEDILSYIQFECQLLKKIQQQRADLNQYERTDEIDRFIYNEIQRQFGSASINFQHKIEFWNARLKFISTIVPEQDREAEFNRMFKAALQYCGRSNLDLYKHFVRFQWSLLELPFVKITGAKRKRLLRKDCSKLMSNIRDLTREALRNFPRSAEASIWVLSTELEYLQILEKERREKKENPKLYISFSIEDETEKSEKFINVLFQDLLAKNDTPSDYIQLYEVVSTFHHPQATRMLKAVYEKLVKIKPRTKEIYIFLISKLVKENKFEEAFERINQALSSNSPKAKMLNMCIEKADECFEQCLVESSVIGMTKALMFYVSIFDENTSNWNQVSSEIYHARRIKFIKELPEQIHLVSEESAEYKTLQSFIEDHPLDKVVKRSLEQTPTSFTLAKERIRCILRQWDENNRHVNKKVMAICEHLSTVDWKKADAEEAESLLCIVYYAITTLRPKKLRHLLKLPPTVPGINRIRIAHLKFKYLEDVEQGRQFYEQYRRLTSNWSFAAAAIEIETTICRDLEKGSYSATLTNAIEDILNIAGTSATEPWKMCVMYHRVMKNEKAASDLLDRALKRFAVDKDNDEGKYQDLLEFSKNKGQK